MAWILAMKLVTLLYGRTSNNSGRKAAILDAIIVFLIESAGMPRHYVRLKEHDFCLKKTPFGKTRRVALPIQPIE